MLGAVCPTDAPKYSYNLSNRKSNGYHALHYRILPIELFIHVLILAVYVNVHDIFSGAHQELASTAELTYIARQTYLELDTGLA